jgi:hypothetical protein
MTETQWFSGECGILPLKALANPDLKIRTKLVLASIASCAGPDGRTAAISKKTIASRAGLPATNLARELRELVDSGWLEVERQPGANSAYRLRMPGTKARQTIPVAPQQTMLVPVGPVPVLRLADAPIILQTGTVESVTRHNNSWLVVFLLDDDSRITSLFTECSQPCRVGETAHLRVREWKGRKGIAGGATNGIHWLRRHPLPPPIEARYFDLGVSQLRRFGTPAGRMYISFTAANDLLSASAMLPEQQLPTGVADGSRIRVSRSDGTLISVAGNEPHFEISGREFVIELAA